MARKQSEGGMCSIASRLHPERNEDSGYVYEKWGEAGVFDGVGGNPGSHLAAYIVKQVVSTLVEEFHEWGLENRSEPESRLLAARKELQRAKTQDIGTTAVVAKLINDERGATLAQIAWAGDSRAYVFSKRYGLRCATLDHGATRLFAYDIGRSAWDVQRIFSQASSLSEVPEDLRHVWEHRNMVYSTIGNGVLGDLTIERQNKYMLSGDVLLLSTDGIHDNLTTSEIETVLMDGGSSDELVAEAKSVSERGTFRSKPDDMTAAILKI